MKLTTASINLLKFAVTTDGKKEASPEGKEVDSPRRLNGEESSQRRFFMKEALRIEEAVKPEIQQLVEGYNKFLADKKEGYKKDHPRIMADAEAGTTEETEAEWDHRLVNILETDVEVQARFEQVKAENKAIGEKIHDLELTEKTVEFIKKYYKLFGDEVGYLPGDDIAVQEINSAFGF